MDFFPTSGLFCSIKATIKIWNSQNAVLAFPVCHRGGGIKRVYDNGDTRLAIQPTILGETC